MALTPFLVEESIPNEEEVVWAINCLRRNRARDPYGIRAEHLRSWMRVYMREESTDPDNWEKVAGLINDAFHEVHLAYAMEEKRGTPPSKPI